MKSLALLLFVATGIFGAENEVLAGHEGWVDRMGAGVLELGRGNTGTAFIDATPAAYWNPAVLPFQRKPQVAMGAEIRSMDRNGGYLSFQERLTGNLGAGLGILTRGDFSFPAYDENEKYLGTVRPQAFASYLGVGLRTSRNNAFGATVLWYASNLDVGDGYGNLNFVGGFNLGWFHRFPDSISAAVVVRNLGINERLSAEFDQIVSGNQTQSGFQSTETDFFPKTLIAAGEWRKNLWQRPWIFAAEIIDYQLKSDLFTPNPAFHSPAFRVGADWEPVERAHMRTGVDRGDITFGLGYTFLWHRRPLQFDYALILERGWMTFNPYAVGLKTVF